VRSLTSIMSTTGEPDFSQPEPEALAVLLNPPADDRESRIAASVEAGRLLSAKRYFDADATRRRAAVQLDRAFYPEGTLRHMGAVVASGDRAAGLVDLRVPTLVIHGSEDPLIPPKGGVRTAELVPHADLLMIGHMGHDLPEPLWPLITGSILAHTGRADSERSRS
jgi:pimeloyl-ACP methyl ester carboxylesterase